MVDCVQNLIFLHIIWKNIVRSITFNY
uniref:Uncharacterized protein n=1 Tax=Anguilla anguilla TaxID=7936 RepID=A0A0E9UHQ6_ANGAN